MTDLNSEIPWASFCMSTYRRTGFLRETLALIRAQTFLSFEVVVSDNDPEGSAAAVVAEFQDPRFRYFHNETNLGMVKSFNKSIERSRGQYIVLLPDDDPVYPNMLQTLYDLQVKYPGYGQYIGGHDTVFKGLLQARMAKAHIGTNSSLADWELGAEKVYSAGEFPEVFLNGTFGGGLLFSVGAVRRDIAIAVGGFPDYGTPHLADCSFTLLSGAIAGVVYVNTEVGCRTIHDENYSYSEANYESLYKAPEGFYQWTLERLPPAMNTPYLRDLLSHYCGRDMTFLVISIKKMLLLQKVNSEKFEAFRRRFFDLALLKKWRRKYYISVHFPNAFEVFLAFRKMLFPPSPNKTGK
jgi:glycosyltransferase involved in cell wall biosynthesis